LLRAGVSGAAGWEINYGFRKCISDKRMSDERISPVLPRLYLLDVEGTTSPISLVYDQLFPYARTHLHAFLREHGEDPGVRADLGLLAAENRDETAADTPRLSGDHADEAAAYLLWLMDQDRKSTALKALQGRVWRAGFDAGELIGTVFPDVPDALARWSGAANVAIYSSGSVEAQKLLFLHSSAGDLTPYISAYFDTRIGPKTAAESYRAIASAMGINPGQMLFVSDVVRELDPAREAGCSTRLSVREGNQVVPDTHGHLAVDSFRFI
jgi:enolase-phosphatase E1